MLFYINFNDLIQGSIDLIFISDYDARAGLHCQSVLTDRRSSTVYESNFVCRGTLVSPCCCGRTGGGRLVRAGSLDPSLSTPSRSATIINWQWFGRTSYNSKESSIMIQFTVLSSPALASFIPTFLLRYCIPISTFYLNPVHWLISPHW